MKRKKLTIISTVSIIIISLILLGITYGYYLTVVDGNSSSKSVEVVTGDSKVVFTDLSTSDTSEIIEPGFKTVKLFTVQNTGDVSATFSIFLVDVINDFNRTQDITYNLYKKQGTITDVTKDTDLSSWTKVNTVINPKLPTESEVIASNETITTPNEVYTYVLKVEYYNHPTENQNEDQGKTFAFKVNLRSEDSDTNPYSEGTLAYNILNNGAQVLNTTTNKLEIDKTYTEKTQIAKVSDGTDMEDVGIFTAPDDYGESYYYRGTVKNNYVDFAGFTWRIVRINGDGSVRLILDGTLDKICVEYNEDNTCKTFAGADSSFNSLRSNNAYVGYMHGLALSDTENIEQNRCLKLNETTITDYVTTYPTQEACETNGGKWTMDSYEATHTNIKDSTIKTNVDNFYKTYLLNDYNDHLADTMFCGDKSLASSGIGGVTTQLGYGTGNTNKTYYAGAERLYYINSTNLAEPTLKCAEGENNTYSRYTKEEQNRNNVKTNGDLTYPIALLSADELVLAGAWGGDGTQANKAYYLYEAYATGLSNNIWWSMTPLYFNGSTTTDFSSDMTNWSLYRYDHVFNNGIGVRPVINLKADTLIESGDGTKDNAYTIKEIG